MKTTEIQICYNTIIFLNFTDLFNKRYEKTTYNRNLDTWGVWEANHLTRRPYFPLLCNESLCWVVIKVPFTFNLLRKWKLKRETEKEMDKPIKTACSKPGIMVHACSIRTQEAEAGGSTVQGLHGLHREFKASLAT
jgi:hypothetical protein